LQHSSLQPSLRQWRNLHISQRVLVRYRMVGIRVHSSSVHCPRLRSRLLLCAQYLLVLGGLDGLSLRPANLHSGLRQWHVHSAQHLLLLRWMD